MCKYIFVGHILEDQPLKKIFTQKKFAQKYLTQTNNNKFKGSDRALLEVARLDAGTGMLKAEVGGSMLATA